MRRAGPLAFVCLLAVTLLGTRARAADSVDECVAISTSPEEKGLTFDVTNNCDRRLSCALTWTVECLSNNKVQKRTKAESRFQMSASSKQAVNGSAKSCNGDWRIDEVGWDCSPTK